MHGLSFALAFAAARGSGVVGGVFFAFSSFVMAALARRPAHEGIAAMQSINVVVLNRSFLGVVAPADAEAERLWADYVRAWTRWNTVRAAASIAACAAFVAALAS